jgi:uncharacterized OB-fold protein
VDPVPSRPLPVATTETAPYWRAALAGRLEIQRCRACARHQFYPRPFCIGCLSDDLEWVEASGRGQVYTWTVCHVAAHPAFEARVPYALAMVELDEGVRMLAGIVDSDLERLAVGARVRVCFEPIGDEFALPMFQLSEAS